MSLPATKHTKSTIELGFWLQWCIINAAGISIGVVSRQFLFGLGSWAYSQIIAGALVGGALGIVQLFGLQHRLERSGRWIVSSIIGWAVAWSIGWPMGLTTLGLGLSTTYTFIGTLAGFLTGSMQWGLLRHKSRQALWWILINSIGWGIGMDLGIGIGGGFGWVLVGAISGTITGIPLAWILQQDDL